MDKILFNVDIFKIGYIIVVKKTKKDFFGNQIYKQQKKMGFSDEAAEYTHVEVSMGEKDSMRIMPPKAKVIDITKFYKGRTIRLMKIKDEAYDKGKRYKIALFAMSLCNKPYDVLGILKFKVPLLFHCKNKFFCSEGTLWAIQKVLPEFWLGEKPYNCMPAHFYEDEYLELIWEGVIS